MNVKLEPLRWLLHPVALLAFAAAAQAWLDGATVRGVVAACLGVLVAAATEAARRRVVPGAKVGYVDRDVSSWSESGPVPHGRVSFHDEDGYGIVDAILIVFLVAVCLVVLFHFA